MILDAVLIRGRRLIEGGTYLEIKNLGAAPIRGRGLLEEIRYCGFFYFCPFNLKVY